MELLMVSLLNSEGRERKMLLRHNFDIHFFGFFSEVKAQSSGARSAFESQ